MKWFLLLIPLLFYSAFSEAVVAGNSSSPTPAQCSARPVLYGVGMHNYWNGSDNLTHAYYEGCEYIQKGVAFDNPSTGYFGDWYPTGSVMPDSGQGSGSHPGNSSDDVDLSSMSSPVLSCQDDKSYNRSGNTTAGKITVVYSGCLYSLSYDSKNDITSYKPLSQADSNQKVLASPHAYFDKVWYSNGETTTHFLNQQLQDIDRRINNINTGLAHFPGDSSQYFNDYNSAKQLIDTLKVYKSAISTDIIHSDAIGYTIPFDFTRGKKGYYFLHSSGIEYCGTNNSDCVMSMMDDRTVKKIYYHNPDQLQNLRELFGIDGRVKYIYLKDDFTPPFKPVFNYQAYDNLFSLLDSNQYNVNSGYSYIGLLFVGHLNNYNHDTYRPFMDFNNQAVVKPDTGDSGSGDTGDSGSDNPGGDTPVTPSGGGSGGGTVTPPDPGGGGGGSGGTDTPGTGSQCVPGSPGWPDCDDQSGQPGGGDKPGDSGSGGDKPGTGGSGGAGGGAGGGHGTGGSGHGGGDTDGDGDALLQEVKRFHADVNAALKPDGSAMPQFSDKDADFSEVQKGLDKQEKEQKEAWVSGADKLKSTLGGISGSLPSTELNMSEAVPVGITGVCRPWEFDIVIGITDGKQFKQHVVMTQFCTWYDTYIRPFVTWTFNFLTAVAVFNILYKGLRTIN